MACLRKPKMSAPQSPKKKYPKSISAAEPLGISRPSRPVVLPARMPMIPTVRPICQKIAPATSTPGSLIRTRHKRASSQIVTPIPERLAHP